MIRPVIVPWLGAVISLWGCDVTAPESGDDLSRLTLALSPAYSEVLEDVDDVRLTVTRPGGGERDTILVPYRTAGEFRVRVVLRPNEGVAGTRIDVSLNHLGRGEPLGGLAYPLFRGWTITGTGSGRILPARIDLEPVVLIVLPHERGMQVGERIAVAELVSVHFPHGRRVPGAVANAVAGHPAVLEIADDSIFARRAGATTLTASWGGASGVMKLWIGEPVPPTDPM